jgi:hypothetical protein
MLSLPFSSPLRPHSSSMASSINASYLERLPVETWSYIFRTLLGSIEDRNERARFVICEDHIQIAQRPFNKFRECLTVCKRWKVRITYVSSEPHL